MDTSRREFLKFMGRTGAVVGLAPTLSFFGCTSVDTKQLHLPFTPLPPSNKDEFILAGGFAYQILMRWKDPINSRGELFGFNNDYIAMIPITENEAYLWVNHESVNPIFVSGYIPGTPRTKKQVEIEQLAVGGSILKVKRDSSRAPWKFVKNDPANRRITGKTKIPLISERPIAGSRTAIGTLANCAGGTTPWKTILTCEENYDLFYGELDYAKGGKRNNKNSIFNWQNHFDYSPEHYGWVVEVEPKTGSAKKLTALGRFAHECATVVLAKDGRAVVYMGDDANDQCVYKFIADRPGSLEKGTLYAADIKNGRWLPLVWKGQKVLKENFKDQTEVLIRCREAAALMGATPLNRPEDVEIDPITGAVFVAQTNNKKKNDPHGSILKIEEDNKDYLSLTFKASTFLAGGKGFSCPDNLAFDRKGNLWFTTDMSGSSMGKPPYTKFKNNGLFYVPMSGPHAGQPFQVASAPNDAELTGPCFSPDGKTLFLSVQHPGEESADISSLTSHWPDGGNAIPSPVVVTITGPALDALIS